MNRSAVLMLALAACSASPTPEQEADLDYRRALDSRDTEEALELVSRAIARSPRADYFLLRASLNHSLKKPDAALADYGSALKPAAGDPFQAPQRAAIHLDRGLLHLQTRDLRSAEEDFSEALRLVPDYTEALLQRAWIRRRLNRAAEAELDVAEARRSGSGQADGYYNEGVRSVTQGDSAEAERMFRFALDLEPLHSRAHTAMARIYMERRLFAEAAAELDEAIPAQPRNAELYYHRGTARLAAGRGEEALADYSKAVELQPFEAPYLAARGQALHRVRHEIEKAKADFAEAIRVDKDCFAAWYHSGVLHHELRELWAAERALRRAAAIRASPEGSLALGRVLHDQGEYDKALSLYRQALEIYKDAGTQKALQGEVERTRQAKENRK
jgi:tetratricopeptide (TPR) repeat protein